MSFVTSGDGVQLFYEQTGDGPALICAHEFSGSTRSFAPQIAALKSAYRCIAYSARGYHPSDAPEQLSSYSQDAATGDIAAIIEALGIDTVHLLGVSMGAAAMLHYAMNNQDRVLSLTLCGIGSGSDDTASEREAKIEAMATFIDVNGMQAFAERMSNDSNRSRIAAKNPVQARDFVAQFSSISPKAIANSLRGIQKRRPSIYAYEDRLKRLNVPTLIVVGADDEPCRKPSAFLSQVLPRARLQIVADSGHMVNQEYPEIFNTVLLQHLRTASEPLETRRSPA